MTLPRLWIASELYYPEDVSTGYFITKIAEALTPRFDVKVACGQPSYAQRGASAARREMVNDVEIHRLRATHFDKDRLALRLINLITFTIAAGWFLAWRLHRSDRILVVTNPPTIPFVCGWLAKLRGCQSFLLVHDIYPEVLAATQIVKPRSIAYRLLQVAFDYSFRMFDHVVVLGRDMKEVVGRKLGTFAGRMTVIPNWGDVDEIKPIEPAKNAFLADNALAGQTIIQFSGNLGRTHDVGLFLDAARSLADQSNTKFLAVGFGGKAALIDEAVTAESADNLILLPRQPRDRLAQMLNASTATMISFVDGMYGISVPSRMYNIMAAGRPIIAVAHPRSELALVVEEENAGWVIGDDDRRGELERLIRHLGTPGGRAEAASRGAAARRAVEHRFTLDIVAQQFCALLEGDKGSRTDHLAGAFH